MLSLRRQYATKSLPAIISIPPGSNIYAFGAPSQSKTPLISRIAWRVEEGEAWAVISGTGGGGKGVIFKTLLGHTRLAAANPDHQGRWAAAGGLYPFLSASSIDPYTRISSVSFRQRTGGDSGAFFDYTARYGAMREEEDKVTLRDSLRTSAGADHQLFNELTERIGLKSLLDLPLITLSNGQTRRARVVKAILDQPELLLLDEPLTGLDPPSRKALTETLRQLHHERSPRIIIGLRKGGRIPPWITHILEVEGGTAHSREASEFFVSTSGSSSKPDPKLGSFPPWQGDKRLLVEMKDVNVAYGERKVLKNINWQIRQGERWHLQGANGSGKTTLTALVTGDHPQSYIQPHLHLPAITTPINPLQPCPPVLQPRKRTPTAHLRQLIGVVSPEMFDAFPRRHPGMSVWEAVTTGFDGGFVPRTRGASADERRNGGVGWVDVADDELGLGWDASNEEKDSQRDAIRKWRVQRCWDVLKSLGPAAWAKEPPSTADPTRNFASLAFSSLSPGEQRLVLLMRALVGRPPLILLDEVWSGMDEDMIAAARRYLRTNDGLDDKQAVVVITHWEEEVPWTGDEVKKFKLD